MPMTPEQLDNWFTYHPPTDETGPKYAAIRESEMRCHKAFAKILNPKTVDPPRDAPLAEDCETVNRVTRNFAEVIDAFAPDSADKSAAIRCVRLARNAMNEWIMSQVVGFPLHIDSAGEATRQLVMARWQGNSAVACGGK